MGKALPRRSGPEAEPPGVAWDERRAAFVAGLGLTEATGYPVVDVLLYRLDELPDQERDEVVGSDRLDALVYELAQECDQPADDPGTREPFGWVTSAQVATLEAI